MGSLWSAASGEAKLIFCMKSKTGGTECGCQHGWVNKANKMHEHLPDSHRQMQMKKVKWSSLMNFLCRICSWKLYLAFFGSSGDRTLIGCWNCSPESSLTWCAVNIFTVCWQGIIMWLKDNVKKSKKGLGIVPQKRKWQKNVCERSAGIQPARLSARL